MGPLYDAPAEPVLIGEAAIAVDVATGEIIFARNADRRLYPASMTKLVTAMLLEENSGEQDLLTYTLRASKAYPHTLRLPVGERISASGAMDALLLFSGNDIALMVAEGIGGSLESFVALMNRKARELGLEETHFFNPTGLHEADHVTTAYDMSRLARALYEYPWIMRTITRRESTIFTESGLAYSFANRNKLTGQNGCVGGKTGFTDEAGRCLVALYERNGRRIVGVVMKSEYDQEDTAVFRDMERLMDYSYGAAKSTLISRGSSVALEEVLFSLVPGLGPVRRVGIPYLIEKDVLLYTHDTPVQMRYEIENTDPWKLDRNLAAGLLLVDRRDGTNEYLLFPALSWMEIAGRFLPFYGALLICLFTICGLAISFLVPVSAGRHSAGRHSAGRHSAGRQSPSIQI
jgi:D-alanyl-D-alanine carboxypeptidase